MRFTSEQEQEAATMYLGGASTYDVAKHYGVSRNAIKMLLRRQNVTVRSRGRCSTQPIEKVAVEVVRLRLEGVRVRDIARRLKVTDSTVSEILLQQGLHTRLKRGENSTARRKIKPEQEPELVRLYEEGATQVELAKKYGCTTTVVCKMLRQAGVLRGRRPVSPYRNDPEFIARIALRWEAGATITGISTEMQIGAKSVSRILRDHGIPPQRASGEKHGMWKGGRTVDENGYIHVTLPRGHVLFGMTKDSGYVLEHRLVMAEYLGRPLLNHESVHHIDGVRHNNDVENLQLRIGQHGAHVCYRCADCGSERLQPVPISDPA